MAVKIIAPFKCRLKAEELYCSIEIQLAQEVADLLRNQTLSLADVCIGENITPVNEFPISVSQSQFAILVFKETPEQLYGKDVSIKFTSELSPEAGVYVYSIPGSEAGTLENHQKVLVEYSQK